MDLRNFHTTPSPSSFQFLPPPKPSPFILSRTEVSWDDRLCKRRTVIGNFYCSLNAVQRVLKHINNVLLVLVPILVLVLVIVFVLVAKGGGQNVSHQWLTLRYLTCLLSAPVIRYIIYVVVVVVVGHDDNCTTAKRAPYDRRKRTCHLRMGNVKSFSKSANCQLKTANW